MGTKVGVISDTHSLLRPEAIAALKGCNLILHAGDIGGPEILTELQTIAPVIAVRGNNDKGDWAAEIPERVIVRIEAMTVCVFHIARELGMNPTEHGIHIVISGHSHKPAIEERDGVLWLNPGSAGPRRFKLPISIAILQVNERMAEAQIIELPV